MCVMWMLKCKAKTVCSQTVLWRECHTRSGDRLRNWKECPVWWAVGSQWMECLLIHTWPGFWFHTYMLLIVYVHLFSSVLKFECFWWKVCLGWSKVPYHVTFEGDRGWYSYSSGKNWGWSQGFQFLSLFSYSHLLLNSGDDSFGSHLAHTFVG